MPRPKIRRIQPEVARARILDAAAIELAEHGFAGASTNAIARRARVAKGLVFHHFATKADLYFAIVDHVSDQLLESYLAITDWPDDLFERLYAISMHKVRFFKADPQAYRVLASIADAPAAQRDVLFAKAQQVRTRLWPQLLRGVDTSRLRPGISLDDALETMTALGEGLERTIIARIRGMADFGASQVEDLVRDAWKHYERLRDGLYR